ncbi:MAG TPA: Pr6Pr family membrane protein [Dyella sp.]|uniref:Pr6Pr family membrane protein n=1 Tax=Dyella sp. TaxID=1869338 RepID=UPI002C400A9C|nr:Pr6Pr family membrane protein [Dyella sp.]HUB91531.1 Pr6Pr family membrane protein [Dyella sp.]
MRVSTAKARLLVALIAVIAWFGVFLQLYVSLRLTDAMGMSTPLGLAIYLGYFTVLTNLLVGVATTLPLLAPPSAAAGFFVRPATVGWVTASIAFVGIAYFVLLRHVWDPQGLQLLADVLMHYVVPALCVVYSLIALRRAPLHWTLPLWWCLYPVGYFFYVLVRGVFIGHYPYHFIDVSQLGYALVLRNAVVLLAAFFGLSYVLMLVWRRLR